jgi:hypothetical protein
LRKWKLLVALAGLAVVVAAEVVVLWPRSSSRITRENFEQIKEGMNRAEVEAILGPPGDYRTGHGETDLTTVHMAWSPDGGPLKPNTDWSRIPGQSPEDPRLWAEWMNDSIVIVIAIGQSGSVVQTVGFPRRRTTQGPLENLLWRAKRQWYRWFPE